LKFQALPLGEPDLTPKRRFIQKKLHGKVDVWGLIAAELRDRGLMQKEGRGRRARKHTSRYEEAVEEGLLAESQQGALGRRK
jgi:hypothetical protein